MKLRIGEFSRITSLSIKTLRLYHEKDILVPAGKIPPFRRRPVAPFQGLRNIGEHPHAPITRFSSRISSPTGCPTAAPARSPPSRSRSRPFGIRVKSSGLEVFWSAYRNGAWSEATCWIEPSARASHNRVECSAPRIGGLHTNFATSIPPA